MKRRKVSFATQILVAVSVLLLAASTALGIVLTRQSERAMSVLIQSRMLDISNTAAAMMDGDVLEQLTAEDAGTEPYETALASLRIFQENIDLEYIYCIRDNGDGTFSFTVDPTVPDPGVFGEPVVTTEALRTASLGKASVDTVPYEDAWGRFYSAYSPVFDSAGKVAGIVAVDFGADWFDNQIAQFTRTVLFLSVFSLAIGLLIVFLLVSRLSSGFRSLDKNLNGLSGDVDTLSKELEAVSAGGLKLSSSEQKQEKVGFSSEDYAHDEIGELSQKIRSIQNELQTYISSIHAQAYSDTMTGTKNKAAYLEAVAALEQKMADGSADFAIAVVDINGMKETNDTYGHDSGDAILIAAAGAMKSVFDPSCVYRIGGDEFILVAEHAQPQSFEAKLEDVRRNVAAYNEQKGEQDPPLYISLGAAFYREGDPEYKAVFNRADDAMYEDKAAFYHFHGERPRHMGL